MRLFLRLCGRHPWEACVSLGEAGHRQVPDKQSHFASPTVPFGVEKVIGSIPSQRHAVGLNAGLFTFCRSSIRSGAKIKVVGGLLAKLALPINQIRVQDWTRRSVSGYWGFWLDVEGYIIPLSVPAMIMESSGIEYYRQPSLDRTDKSGKGRETPGAGRHPWFIKSQPEYGHVHIGRPSKTGWGFAQPFHDIQRRWQVSD